MQHRGKGQLPMIVDLRSVLHGPRYFNLTLKADWWQGNGEDDQIVGLDGPLEASLSISRAGAEYLLEGRLSGRFRLKCGRCLEVYSHDLGCDFRVCLAPGPSDSGPSEVELSEEDLSVDFVTEEQIDLDEIIREQIYLSLPMKCLCREDCPGLCPVCGADLNKAKCECQPEKGHPGFSKLRALRLKGD